MAPRTLSDRYVDWTARNQARMTRSPRRVAVMGVLLALLYEMKAPATVDG